VESTLFKELQGNYTSEWSDGLTFLKSFKLTPPPFRQPLTTKIKYRLEEAICNTFISTIAVCDEALKPHPNPKFAKKNDYNSWELLLLPILFERLVLFPLPPQPTTSNKKCPSINQIIHDRLRRFKQGKLRELYEESEAIVSKTPKQQHEHPADIQRSAQLAADLDNFKSANARITKHAPVALINNSNIHVLENLHPPSLNRGCNKPRVSTRNGGTRRSIQITPKTIVSTLSHLHRGKATGVHCDSLDIYIKTARRIDLSNPTGLQQATHLASFFEHIVNGHVPEQFKHFIRQTYLVALEKDPDDKTKLRPLGVPSAIRRISAILILKQFNAAFAQHILPFNFAIGIGGGCDFIIKTLQLAVDKYIVSNESANRLPTRALVSLDIRNMFNAISRERLREVIATKFPSLEPFADLIYDGVGETFVKLEDGSWTVIAVQEGFSQGCPASPVFAAIVLNEILTQLHKELALRAALRKSRGDTGDDNDGTLALILAYVDDCNILLHLDDVKFFLDRFVQLASPLGAVLNTEKTRILTATNGTPVTTTLLTSSNPNDIATGRSLQQAIALYSRKQTPNGYDPVEVVDGLRVLGSPIGSHSFCQAFLQNALTTANNDATKLTTSLESLQTILRLYSVCTVHKLTHLFGCDVINSDLSSLPPDIHLWNSDLTDNFSRMTENILTDITNSHSLPAHAHIIANMSIKQGGLGLQHPRLNAITSFMLSTKRSLQYSHQGVWLGHNSPQPILPHSISSLYSDWQSSHSRTWQIFRKYLPRYNQICANNADNPESFIFDTSINGSKEKAKEFASKRTFQQVLLNDDVTPADIKPHLAGMLDNKASMALMCMSRLDTSNQMKNDIFTICLKRKLRLKIFDTTDNQTCKCGKQLDDFGDHCLGCTANHKTRASNNIRDGIAKTLQRILPAVHLIDSPTQVETEVHNIVPSLPRLKPFDLSVRLDHSLTTGAIRTPYSRIGFDVTLIHSTRPPAISETEAAQYTDIDLRLREGERLKFVRRTGGTNKITKRTLSADEVIGEIMDGNNCLIPIAVGPYGELGSLFRRFLRGDTVIPITNFDPDRPHARRAYDRATHIRTPYDILGKADKAWKRDHGDSLFGFSYLAPTPSTWADQQIGLVCQTSIANHIKASFTKMTFGNGGHTSPDSPRTVVDTEEEWQYHDGDFPLDLMDEPETITDIAQVDTTFQRESQDFLFCVS
jgi:hypothetical protein